MHEWQSTQTGERIEPALAGLETLLLRAGGMLLVVLSMWFGAHVAIPVPPFGVPQTLQTLVVICSALCLGPRFGTAAMAAYVLAGALGAPIFADDASGMAVLLGQTGGYLIGFIASQPVITWFVLGRDGRVRGWLGLILGVVAGHLVVFAFGVPWLWAVRWLDEPLSLSAAIYGGMVVFLPGMVVKCVLAVLIGRVAAPWASRRVW